MQSNSAALPSVAGNGYHVSPVYRPVRGVRRAAADRVLYVSDASYLNQINVLQYGTWTQLAPITDGVDNPAAVWVGKNHNLYVANYSGPNITEYDPSGNRVNTYSSGITAPVDVTTDELGNVYEADYNGYVNEYAEGGNTAIGHCSIEGGALVTGVAVDRRGNVFIDYQESALGSGLLGEYKNGLTASKCIEKVFPITFVGYGGIVFDRQGSLIACAIGTGSVGSAVDIIAKPFTTITGTLGSGYLDPNFATVDQAGTQVYVSDPSTGKITILSYPSGSIIATLGKTNGVLQPVSAVDSKNYVP
jgi:hypothetical protein